MLVTPKRAPRPAWLIPVAMGGVLALGIGIGVAIGLGVFSSPKVPTTPAVVIGEPPLPAPVQHAVRPQEDEPPAPNVSGEEDEALVPPPPLRPDPNAPEPRETRSYALEADDNNVPTAVEPVPVARPAAPEPAPQLASLAPVPPQSVKPPPGSPPWIRNAVATPRGAAGHPMIAVMLDDVGVDRKGAEKAILLKAPMTLSFMTYAEDLQRMTTSAHARGHELMVHVPMQPMGEHLDAGPQVLTVNLSADEIRRRLEWGLSRFDGYVGINNHMGSRFTADAAGMNVVMAEMKRRGLLFVDSVTTGHSAAPEMARRYGVPFASRNVFLDNEQSVDAIRAQLAQVEAYARKHGAAIAIGHPHETTIEALHGWLGTLEAKGFVLVPVTTIVKASQGQ